MAKQVKLKAEPRNAIGRSAARRLKGKGFIPAVVYGGKEKSQPLQVSARDISAMLSHASGENILVELEIAGAKASRTALLQEVQHSPLGDEILHVDFHAISMDEKIEASVPLEPLGIANGVKNFGGLLDQNIRSLTVECFPKDLPDKITVDVSALNIGDSIHVRDIKLPNGVVAKVNADLTAFSVAAPVAEEEPVTPEAEAAAAAGPEVITAKKEEGEEAVPAPGGKGAPAKGAPAAAGKGAATPAKGAPAAPPKEKEQKK
jgi:large subunit ribosomal protein L25